MKMDLWMLVIDIVIGASVLLLVLTSRTNIVKAAAEVEQRNEPGSTSGGTVKRLSSWSRCLGCLMWLGCGLLENGHILGWGVPVSNR
jgi:hypothetical protein